jgi:polar amino acid transport system substrate-binding protein
MSAQGQKESMANTSQKARRRWVYPSLWILLVLDLVGALLLPPWLDDDTRRRIATTGAMRVGLDPAYPPFENDVQGELVGYDVDLARELGQELGLEVVLVPMGYDSLYDALVTGEIDLILCSYPYSPELCQRERCTAPYFEAGQVLAVSRGSDIAGPDDLTGRRVGVEWGGAGDALVRPWEKSGQVGERVPYMGPQEALEALLAGEVDAVVVDRISALTLATPDQVTIQEPPLMSEAFVIVTARRSVWLHRRLQQALRQLGERGALASLEQRWLR